MKIPTKADHLRPLSHKQRCAKFGKFTFTPDPQPNNPERIIIDPKWIKNSIISVEVPQLKRKIQVHKLVADDFLKLFSEWEKAGLSDRIVTFNGCWAPRFKRGKSGGTDVDLSNHSWASATDLNAKQNPLDKPPAPVGKPGSLIELVPIAESLGFAWGGWFNRPDGMHFEWAGL